MDREADRIVLRKRRAKPEISETERKSERERESGRQTERQTDVLILMYSVNTVESVNWVGSESK